MWHPWFPRKIIYFHGGFSIAMTGATILGIHTISEAGDCVWIPGGMWDRDQPLGVSWQCNWI